jgi:hypothetical protein
MIYGHDIISDGDKTIVSPINGTLKVPTFATPEWSFSLPEIAGCGVETNNNTYIYIENSSVSILIYHMSSCKTGIGSEVLAGQPIATEGSVGISFESHSHYAVNIMINGVRYPICNINFFAAEGENTSFFTSNCSAENAYTVRYYNESR